MSFFDSIDLAASGLTAERVRMDVTAENLANAQTTDGPGGQPYRRQEVVLQQVGGGFGASWPARWAAARPQRRAASKSPGSSTTRPRTSSSMTPVIPGPTRRATCACPTSIP